MNTYTEIDANKRRTVFLFTFFIGFILALNWFFYRILHSPIFLIIAFVIGAAEVYAGYYKSDKIALWASGATPLPRQANITLHRLVENLAITAGLPKPRIYLTYDPAPNAFATGRDPKHAAICVTTGLLEKLDKGELEGVLSHEISHIRNHDTLLMSAVIVLVASTTLMSDLFLRGGIWRDGVRGRNRDDAEATIFLVILGFVLAIASPIIAKLVQLAISRRREFLADASGALLTRFPEGLASALEKISNDPTPLRVMNKATAHLFIADPVADYKYTTRRGWFAHLYDTHPPIRERIARLRRLDKMKVIV